MRGFISSPIFETGASIVIGSFVVGIITTILVSVWAKNKQQLTGQQTPMGKIALLFCVVIPVVCYFVMGSPISSEMPELRGFNFEETVLALSRSLLRYLLHLVFIPRHLSRK